MVIFPLKWKKCPFISLKTKPRNNNSVVVPVSKYYKYKPHHNRPCHDKSYAKVSGDSYFLCILESGELHLKGDRGCLAVLSTSLKSIFFSIGLLIFELDLRLFDCKEIKLEIRSSSKHEMHAKKYTNTRKL